MTAITDLAGRAAPGRAAHGSGRPTADALSGSEQDGDFATLVNTARSRADRPAASAQAGAGKSMPASAPKPESVAASPPPGVADNVVDVAGLPPKGTAAAPVGLVAADVPGDADPVTGKATPAGRGKRARPAAVEGQGEVPVRAVRIAREEPVDETAAKSDDNAESSEKLVIAAGGLPVSDAPTLVPVAPAQPNAASSQPQMPTDASLAAASSLVALVAAQQAATPAVDRRGLKAERPIAAIGDGRAPRTAALLRDDPVAPAAPKADATAPAVPSVRNAPLDPPFIAPPVAGKAEGRADAAPVPAFRSAAARTEPVAVDGPSTAAAPQRMFVIPSAAGAAEALGNATIDMGVEGQWIDRMAREITQLAAGNGSSRFQLLPAQLGRIQVELALGDAGTMVRMTTETDEAADRLRAGSAQLQADARMASLPLASLVIDRAAAGGFDMTRDNGQNAGQQTSGGRAQADLAGQSGGQSSGQSNASSGEQRHKAGGRDAVLNDRSESEAPARTAPAADRRVRFA